MIALRTTIHWCYFNLTGFVTAYESCDLSASITTGIIRQALYEVQDGTIPYNKSDLSETISHTVRGPGYFSVKVTTTDKEDNKVSDARGIKVSMFD